MAQLCSIVVPVYNEVQNIACLHEAIKIAFEGIEYSYEIVFVNDGSLDGSSALIDELHEKDPQIRLIDLTRNYGHEAAMIAGIDHCCGDMVICMDADMQHPPEMIPKMLAACRQGNDVVVMARTDNTDSPWINKQFSFLFYWLLNKLSGNSFQPNASDFFLMTNRVATILRSDFRERTRFLRAFVQSVGFRRTYISFVAPPRAFGHSKYSFSSLCNLSVNALFSFSNLPLRLGILAGICSGGFSLIVLIYSIVMKFLGVAPSGYTTVVALITLLFAVQFVIIGIIGEYIGMLFVESKKRPIYLIDSIKYFQGEA